jgi:putative endonuclease
MTRERHELGVAGERAAESFLRRRGYTIVERNYRCALGEIDLVALDGRTVVFIEVKTRRGAVVQAAFDAVSPRKQRQIVRAAEHYLAARRLQDRDVRFDVVAVWREGAELVCELMRDAFQPDDRGGW